MSRAVRYSWWLARVAVFLLLVAFALKNSDPVLVRFYLGSHWEASLALVLLVAFCIGTMAGVVACVSYIYRQRREILQLRRDLRARPGVPEDAI
jgi:lipopolysaccharide assembly protein A